MTRRYELRKRAERQEETRRRIAEAALDLHASLGPARTSISAIAERAGVQRHTVYSHFPDERAMHVACSGLHAERDPLPDPEELRAIGDAEARLRHALEQLYAYYERNEKLLANVVRDLEVHDVTRETAERNIRPVLARFEQLVAAGFGRGARVHAAVAVVLGFRSWQTLARHQGLSRRQAIATAVAMVRCQ